MESRDMGDVDGGGVSLLIGQGEKRSDAIQRALSELVSQETRPDAILRYLLEHSTFEMALLWMKGQYSLWHRVGKEFRKKAVTDETLYAAFVAEPVDSGWLSPDVMRCGVGMAGPFAVKFIAPGHQKIQFSTGGNTTLMVTAPLPPLVFAGVHMADDTQASTYYVWAMREPGFSPDAVLYHAPFPNVYEEGRICWGENRPPDASRRSIDEAWKLFIEDSLFTGEMGGSRSQTYDHDVRGLFLSLENAACYPVEDLVPFSSKQTLLFTSRPVRTVSDAVEKYVLREEDWQ